MKTTLLTPALAAILGLALAGAPVTVHAQNAVTTGTTTDSAPVTTSSETTKPTAPKKTPYSGTLLEIDATANTITVQSSKTKLVLAVATTTVIQKDKKPATLMDFVVGNKVTGSYTKDATTGTMTAATLRTKTPAPPKTAAPAASTNAPATPATPAAQ